IVFAETLGRDIVNLDPAESRFVTNLLGKSISPSNFIGAGDWTGFYNNILSINTTIAGLSQKPLTDSLSAQQIAITRGFLNTYRAMELYNVWTLRGPNGTAFPLPNLTPSNAVGPILCQTSALAEISAILDSAYTDLASAPASTALPFTLPAGFSSNGDFTTAGAFAQVNRALKGRADLYRGIINNDAAAYQSALTALNASFVDASGDLTTGIYYTYNTAPNEQANPIGVNTIFLTQAVGDSVNPNDKRKSKIVDLRPDTVRAYSVFSTYTSPLASTANQTGNIPMLRNAELVLLRAQAQIGLGNLAAATADVNAVHMGEGGLPSYAPFTTARTAIDSTLYEKRYSLLLTGAQRLVDLRSYGRLGSNGATYFAKERSTDVYQSALPIPQGERDARNGSFACTGT
ncbi:MAG TPA: hypothetical protein VGD56_09890, partial [Gemmatirosa sp.]